MPTVVLDLPGLSARLLDRLTEDRRPAWLSALIERGRAVIEPVLPAVTMPVQATYTTGVLPQEHGVVANGFAAYRDPTIRTHLDLDSYPDYRSNVSFWEQSNDLLRTPRKWLFNDAAPPRSKTALLFFQSAICAADIVVTPKPTHTPDGKTTPDCWTNPPELNAQLQAELGMFPLHHYWGPIANIESSKWIAGCAESVWSKHAPDLMLTYVPHLDYNLQRLGPSSDGVVDDLAAVFEALTPLAERVTADGAQLVLLSEYGMTDVDRSLAPNVLLREAGLLRVDAEGEVDYTNSTAFAMCDHQVAHVYVSDPAQVERVAALFEGRDEVASLNSGRGRAEVGLDCDRAGDVVLFANENAWFEYKWWNGWAPAPDYAFMVDIHRKPGYDPTELFADPATRRTRADQPELVRGSHGTKPADPADWPVLLGVAPTDPVVVATDVAGLII